MSCTAVALLTLLLRSLAIEVRDGRLAMEGPDGEAVLGLENLGLTIQRRPAGGLGVRYLFAADLGLWIGADLARGPEDDVFYIQVGHAW